MLIGLTGAAGSGKSTVAQMLVDNHNFAQFALSDPMKEALLVIDPIVTRGDLFPRLSDYVDKFGWDQTKREVPEVRRLLQKFGTEAGRDLHGENVWVDLTARRIEANYGWMYGSADFGSEFWDADVVISDIRFDNEAQWVLNAGGYIVQMKGRADGNVTSHASENGINSELITASIANVFELDKLAIAVAMTTDYLRQRNAE